MESQKVDFSACFPIDAASTQAYEQKRDVLLEAVNTYMAERPDIEALIGHNDLHVMYGNHRNHLEFMHSVFSLNEADLLQSTIPWVYRAYHAHGFSYSYFPIVLKAWVQAIEAAIEPGLARSLVGVYRCMIAAHTAMIAASQQPVQGGAAEADRRWAPLQRRFLRGLVEGDHHACLTLATEHVHTIEEIGGFFTQVMQPALYEIGRMWERNDISVAQEHLASSIAGRVITSIYLDVKETAATRSKAIVTAAPEEFHQLGAWMLSDLLEFAGWQVRYLGANTPAKDVVDLVQRERPALLCVSVTMPFNLDSMQSLLGQIRAVPNLITKTMVGGAAFNGNPDLAQKIGADGYAPDAVAAVTLANEWWDGDLKWKVL